MSRDTVRTTEAVLDLFDSGVRVVTGSDSNYTAKHAERQLIT